VPQAPVLAVVGNLLDSITSGAESTEEPRAILHGLVGLGDAPEPKIVAWGASSGSLYGDRCCGLVLPHPIDVRLRRGGETSFDVLERNARGSTLALGV
tara:strand:- start:4117 stop:4410 length:294 start_codon:yes stop_codon:yes gene_type:complete